MAGTTYKKRSRDDASKSKAAPPLKKQKKQKKQQQTPSRGDESDDAQEFKAVNLLDSDDDDIHNAQADDGGDSGSDADSIGSVSSSEDERPRATRTKPARPQPIARDVPANKLAKDAPVSRSKSGWDDAEDQGGDDDDEGENDEYSDLDGELSSDGHSGDGGHARGGDDQAQLKRTSKNKRNDPEAFSTSMTKILGTKISGKNRADPVLARSAEARERVRQVLDEDLDRKARRKMREQRQRAMEKGRVRDVLVATNATFSNVNPVTGKVISVVDADGETTAEVLATERRLRKVAQRGVVQLFNAFRTAQVKAAEAERVARKQGVIGMDNKKDKVTEMSKKGFLDLIASGGGGLKKGPIEEA